MADRIGEYDLEVALWKATDDGSPDAVVQALVDAAEHPERLDDVTPAQALITACETLARFDRHDEAIELARRAVEVGREQEVLDPRTWLAKILIGAGHSEEGLAEHRVARRAHPDDWHTYEIVGEAFELAGDPRRAIACFTSGGRRALSRGERFDAYRLLGPRWRVRQALGFPRDADDRWAEEVRGRLFPDLRRGPGPAALGMSRDGSTG
ncbi:MAG: hypothetical protein ACRDN9_18515, partial [Streptosporangiaceae bacterium]